MVWRVRWKMFDAVNQIHDLAFTANISYNLSVFEQSPTKLVIYNPVPFVYYYPRSMELDF